ncbi:MAG TPA: hypothetical protein VFT70_17425 [Nocardioides sp.]|nr:hypothetical protein [Nocardioides sp.]
MAKRKAFLHIGLPRTGAGFLDSALAQHADALEARGLRHPAISTEEMFRAAIEIRRDHRAWGYQRREVEGTWAGICRRAWKGRHDVVLSQELLAGCTPEQIDLLLDGLHGFQVHVVVTARRPGGQPVPDWVGPDLGEVVRTWTPVVRPDRLHVVVVPETEPEQAVWTGFGEIAGFDAADLPLPRHWSATRPVPRRPYPDLLEVGERWRKQLADGGCDVRGDTDALLPVEDMDAATTEVVSSGALADVVAEVTRLRAHNQALAERNAELERKRKKLKKRLAAAG